MAITGFWFIRQVTIALRVEIFRYEYLFTYVEHRFNIFAGRKRLKKVGPNKIQNVLNIKI
jgi:hypothetical protein